MQESQPNGAAQPLQTLWNEIEARAASLCTPHMDWARRHNLRIMLRDANMLAAAGSERTLKGAVGRTRCLLHELELQTTPHFVSTIELGQVTKMGDEVLTAMSSCLDSTLCEKVLVKLAIPDLYHEESRKFYRDPMRLTQYAEIFSLEEMVSKDQVEANTATLLFPQLGEGWETVAAANNLAIAQLVFGAEFEAEQPDADLLLFALCSLCRPDHPRVAKLLLGQLAWRMETRIVALAMQPLGSKICTLGTALWLALHARAAKFWTLREPVNILAYHRAVAEVLCRVLGPHAVDSRVHEHLDIVVLMDSLRSRILNLGRDEAEAQVRAMSCNGIQIQTRQLDGTLQQRTIPLDRVTPGHELESRMQLQRHSLSGSWEPRTIALLMAARLDGKNSHHLEFPAAPVNLEQQFGHLELVSVERCWSNPIYRGDKDCQLPQLGPDLIPLKVSWGQTWKRAAWGQLGNKRFVSLFKHFTDFCCHNGCKPETVDEFRWFTYKREMARWRFKIIEPHGVLHQVFKMPATFAADTLSVFNLYCHKQFFTSCCIGEPVTAYCIHPSSRAAKHHLAAMRRALRHVSALAL